MALAARTSLDKDEIEESTMTLTMTTTMTMTMTIYINLTITLFFKKMKNERAPALPKDSSRGGTVRARGTNGVVKQSIQVLSSYTC